jgi:hypothetical protein
VGNEVWLGALTTLLGALLGGVITFLVSHQQLRNARLQRQEEAKREQRIRSEDRRFQAYSEFLTRARSYRNGVQSYYINSSSSQLSIDELNVLHRAADDASTLVFLVVESDATYDACVELLRALWRAQTTIHNIEPTTTADPWRELGVSIGRAARGFQVAARTELEVHGPTRPWDSTYRGPVAGDRQT